MDNYTDFASLNMATNGLVKMAIDDIQSDQNWTSLVEKYWTLIEDKLGGEFLICS